MQVDRTQNSRSYLDPISPKFCGLSEPVYQGFGSHFDMQSVTHPTGQYCSLWTHIYASGSNLVARNLSGEGRENILHITAPNSSSSAHQDNIYTRDGYSFIHNEDKLHGWDVRKFTVRQCVTLRRQGGAWCSASGKWRYDFDLFRYQLGATHSIPSPCIGRRTLGC